MGPICTIADLTDMMRRRARLLLLVTVFGTLFSALFALSQPQVHQATEVIQIVRPTLAGDPADPAFPAASPSHLRQVEQRLMARRNLLEIIEAFNLFAEFPDMPPVGLVNLLRQAVRFEHIAATGDAAADTGAVSLVSVTARMANPFQARQVAREFAQRLISENSVSRIAQAQASLTFLVAQQDRLHGEIGALQDLIAEYSTLHGPQPQAPGGGSRLSGMERELQQLRREMEVISTSRAGAAIGLRLETGFQTERLSVIEPATLPVSPVPGNRKWIALAGSALSVVLGLALAFLLELRKPVLRSARQMQRETGFAPMVSIPFLDPVPAKASIWQRYQDWLEGPSPPARPPARPLAKPSNGGTA